MQIYLVGGAVRDALLGLPVKDKDYVVVGARPEEMIAQGFKPVGKDFPVFLHPKTHEEYALARTERKTAKGYKGFQVYASPEVTLEEDLARRDLTINAMAMDENGQLIDPYKGSEDIKSRVLRHVSPAFSEDPVRILRIARFAARYADFSVAEETVSLMRAMVENGEVGALVSERVWQEVSRGLMESKPSRMFEVLKSCGALQKLMPEVDRLFGVPQPEKHHPEIDTGVHVMMALDYAARQHYKLEIRYAVLTHDLGKGVTPAEEWPSHHGHEGKSVQLLNDLSQRLKVPKDCHEIASITAKYHGDIHRALQLKATTLVKLFQSADGFRRPDRFRDILKACECDARGRLNYEDQPYPQSSFLINALEAATSINTAEIAASQSGPDKIASAIYNERVAAVKKSTKE